MNRNTNQTAIILGIIYQEAVKKKKKGKIHPILIFQQPKSKYKAVLFQHFLLNPYSSYAVVKSKLFLSKLHHDNTRSNGVPCTKPSYPSFYTVQMDQRGKRVNLLPYLVSNHQFLMGPQSYLFDGLLSSSPPSPSESSLPLFLLGGASTLPPPSSFSSSSSSSSKSSPSPFSSGSKSLASSSSSARPTGLTRYSVPRSSYVKKKKIYNENSFK